jgi:hypothetical protein
VQVWQPESGFSPHPRPWARCKLLEGLATGTGEAHAETLVFLMLRWDAIQRVAAGLLKDGRLTARQVRALARI